MTPKKLSRIEKVAQKIGWEMTSWQTHHLTDIPLRRQTLANTVLRALKAERRRALKEAASIAQGYANTYRLIQERSAPGEKDGMIRKWAAESIRDSIIKSSKDKPQ